MSTNGRPLLSIAMPTYQHGHTLPVALDSILASPRASEVEIVISNNASTDDTAEVVARYAERCGNILSLVQPSTVTFDENLARAMERCTGRFIWTMSSDDVVTEQGLAAVLDAVAGLSQDMILFGNWWVGDGDVRPVRLRLGRRPTQTHLAPREGTVALGVWAVFMSCLVLPADSSHRLLSHYRTGAGLTHWKIATHLSTEGVEVIEIGAPIVVQRIPDPVSPPYYDVPIVLSHNIREHLDALRADLSLAGSVARRIQSRCLRIVLRGMVGTALQRYPAVGYRWFRPLLRDYWTYPAFWIWVVPLYLIPRPILRFLWSTYVNLRAPVLRVMGSVPTAGNSRKR